MEWNEESIGRLRAFWAEGFSTAEIGRRMGITKNAVVGKAHRLQLSSRPSPIRRERRVEPVRLRRIPCIEQRQAERPPAPAVSAAAPRPVERPRTLAPVAPSYGGRVSPCCWPIGEPGTKSFRFCDAGTLVGKPYCFAHAQLAYVRVRDKRDAVA